MLLTRGHRFSPELDGKSQLTQLFHHKEIVVFCWLDCRLTLLNLVFSVLQFKLYTYGGVKGGVRCTLLIRVLFYTVQEYYSS
jgi:hypothetical protein